MGLSNGLKEEHEALFSRIFICVKEQDFYLKKLLFLKKYIFVKKQYFYNRFICKKAAFLRKNDVFFQRTVFLCNIYIYIYALKYNGIC